MQKEQYEFLFKLEEIFSWKKNSESHFILNFPQEWFCSLNKNKPKSLGYVTDLSLIHNFLLNYHKHSVLKMVCA